MNHRAHVIKNLDLQTLSRQKRQLLLPRLAPRSRLLPKSLLPPPRFPARPPIMLPLVTSAISDRIRTYPYYLQEIPIALGETIFDSVKEAAPHITQALKEISPGIMEIVNVIPHTEKIAPVQQIMKKLPTVIHESMQVAMDSRVTEDSMEDEDYTMIEMVPEVPFIRTPKKQMKTSKTKKSLDTYEETSEIEMVPKVQFIEKPRKQIKNSKMKTPLDTFDETSQNLKEKLSSKWEETKQKAQHLYHNLFQDSEDFHPWINSDKNHNLYNPKKFMKKASSISQTITPAISESLAEMAHIPQKIKKLVKQMQQ
ncbi:uncharacterized protein LOC113231824 [Hyposmocoma kahamanoa]|uniref:uncharacterized protein LOC113231824 n=1 Tax=Hyposmocoma kahamanoa TaxID=1477025 RepID=UPI000E6D9D2D|nr:uncharacterized protein LOC113231824 [Hyposmocoma kahamanoa]